MQLTYYKCLLSCAGGILLLAQANVAVGGSETGSTLITATPNNACAMSTPSNLNFNSVTSNDTFPINHAYNISVTCSIGASYTVTHNQGENYTGSINSAAAMVNGSSKIIYHFYQGASGNESEWDANTGVISGTGNGLEKLHPAMMKITNSDAFNDVTSFGVLHSDRVVFTLTF